MTTEEINDGVEILGDSSFLPINVKRTSSLDTKDKANTERATDLSADAAYFEFLNWKFYSNQDTLYTRESLLYFKNCLIEG